MASESTSASGEKISYATGRILFIVLMLCAIDGMWTAEKAPLNPLIHDGWYIHLMIPFPWIMIGLVGTGIWIRAKQNKLERSFAGFLLLALSIAISTSYNVLGKLTFGR